MEVGYTCIRLAWAAFAHAQALKYLSWLLIWSLLSAQAIFANPSDDLPTVLPFRLVGKSVFVEATVNGKTGHYLFDTGASNLILNSAHFFKKIAEPDGFEMVGFDGKPLSAGRIWVDSFLFKSTSIYSNFAILLDLTSLEKIKQIQIHGIIGHEVLKNLEWQLDFECRQLILMGNDGSSHCGHLMQVPPTDSFNISFSGHIPYILVKLGGKRFRMGLDTGSERNLLQEGIIKNGHFQQRGQLRMAGLTDKEVRLNVGFVPNFSLGGLQADSLEVVLVDLRQVSAELPIRLDGILGVAFMKEYKIAINYQRRKVYLWRPAEVGGSNGQVTCSIE